MMNKSKTIFGLMWLVLVAAASWGQIDSGQTGQAQAGQAQTGQAPDDTQRTPPPAAFGQENPPTVVNENPPISGLDQPSLEPNIQPRSMLLGGIEASESLDSNIGSDARPAFHSVSRGLGGLTMQRLWNRYQFAAAYVGGVGYYNTAGAGLNQIHELQAQQAVLWRTGQLTVRDSLSYLPEGTFGYGSYGGSGGFQLGLGGMGAGLGVLGSSFGGYYGILGSGQYGSLGQAPRVTNVALVDVVQEFSPRTSITAAGSYGIVHFTNTSPDFVNSRQVSAQAGYNYQIGRKDQIALSYGYQSFQFPGIAGANNIDAHIVQGMYGHRIYSRLDMVVAAGPQWTRIQDPLLGPSSRLSVSGRFTVRYRFHTTSTALSFERYDSGGSGFYAGAVSNVARFNASRQLWRRYNGVVDLGFSHNQSLQSAAIGLNAPTYNYGFAGFAIRRQINYNWGAFLGYQWSDQIFSACPVVGSTFCDRISVRHVVTLGVDWHFRPIRID